MKIKKYIDQLVKTGSPDDMECLSDMLEDLVCDLKESDHEKYIQYKFKLHRLAYGEHLSEDMAKHWVSEMKNKDGTVGEHWSYEQTSTLAEKHNKCDFYAVLNMMYSDYYNSRFDTNTYVTLARDWLDNKDVGEGKTLKYYMYVVC